MKLVAASLLLLVSAWTTQVCAHTISEQPFSAGPYRVGERLTYNVSFSNFTSVAHVELLVTARAPFSGRDAFQLKGHIETLDTVYAALLALNHDYITYVDPGSGLPFHGQQIIRTTTPSSEVTMDFNQPAGSPAIPGATTIPGTYNILSAIYRVRALPLTEGATYRLAVRHENETYDAQVKVRGRRAVKTNVGTFDTIVTELKVNGHSRIDDIRAYFSDDQRHVPVLVTGKHPAGVIRAELAGSELIATPPLPPVPVATPPVVVPPNPSATPVTNVSNNHLNDLPFQVGEQLNYQVYLPTINAPVGRATFQVRARSKYFNRDGIWLSVNAQTTNALQHLFVANDLINSYVDPKTLLPFQSELNLVEGRSRSNVKLTIVQEYGTATTADGVRIEIPVGTHDYLSFFYALRTFNLAPPRKSGISLLVNNKPKTLFIEALKREPIQLGSQTIPAIQVVLTTDDTPADKYQLRVWISDDRRRLPLRISARTQIGVIRADLAIIPVTAQ
ncbi:MAG TPA: DUF3108 domain-containing protein [Pyrinomonadaceae bacterium]